MEDKTRATPDFTCPKRECPPEYVISLEFTERLAALSNEGHKASPHEVAAVMARLREELNGRGNCDNCGAPLSHDGGLRCDYCGTVYERPDEAFEETILYSDGEAAFKMTERGLVSLNEARSLDA